MKKNDILMTKRQWMVLTVWLMAVAVWAQDNGLNPVYKVQLGDITYEKNEVKKKVTVGKVLGAIADAADGRVTDINNEEYIPLARNSVMEGLTHVRRLQVVEDGEADCCEYLVTATLSDIAATRKVKVYDRKDSKGREYKETKTYYGAVTTVSINFKNLQTGEITTSTISGHCSEYSLANSTDGAIRTALKDMASNIYKYYNECYPICANIIERGTEKKDKTKELYIDVGSRFVGVDTHFDVFIVGKVAGRETHKHIGRVKVREVLGEDISLCKVQRGGKDIKSAFDGGEAIVAISKD